MNYVNILLPDVKWNTKSVGLFLSLLVLPNLLGMINLSTGFGFNVHFFQIAIFIAAFIYGPKGGLLSGLFGSAYSAMAMGNPYIVVGNCILGLVTGLFAKKFNAMAVGLAFMVQLPWLVATDYYLIHMPLPVITLLVISLALSNLIWALVASKMTGHIKGMLA
ncbi:Uncharacterised protein [Candidatus Bilamarchaeum dharawalense]|uniref:ECF transporter S component n=1 Tax=Candidatus Bilamarchaeum dharawalense TaxID=2885759 RepID=A0A5E4LMV2_9ARCH|nr:Uncharacterised protein [Candidatus Bilamarchaeum dharawalense]